MAEPTGTAREEAERLIATVLAMASQVGLGGPSSDAAPGHRASTGPAADRPAADDSSSGGPGAGSPGSGGPASGGSASSGSTSRGSAEASGLVDVLSGLADQFLGGLQRPASGPAGGPPDDHPGDGHGDRPAGGHGDRPAGGHGDRSGGSAGGWPGGSDSDRPAGSRGEQPDHDWREAYQDTLDSLGAAARARAGKVAGQLWWDSVTRRGSWSTGSAECCVCPVCKAIAGVRDTSPQQAERLATGAGDFASGVASLLRAFSAVTGSGGSGGSSTRHRPAARPTTTPDQAWSAATRRAEPAPAPSPEREVREGDDPWSAATRAPRPAEAAPVTETPGTSSARAAAPVTETAGMSSARAAAPGNEPPGTPSARAAAPVNGTAETAAEQAAAQTGAATDTTPAEMPAPPRSRSADPWGAATRAARQPSPPTTAAAAQPTTGLAGSTRPEPVQRAGAAVGDPGARTGEKPPARPGNRPLAQNEDVWAAATGEPAGDTGVAHPASVDHDVPAASAAEDRGAGPGDDARSGDSG